MERLIEFPNSRGRLLRGMIHQPRRRRGRVPGVVFFHGFTGDRMESHWLFVKSARALAAAGIASLRFDFYGSGESEGEFGEVTLAGEISDARAAIGFIRRQRAIDPERVGLVGLSMGGAIAACLAASSGARALALWSALAHPEELAALAERTTRLITDGTGAREYSAHRVSAQFLSNIRRVDPLRSLARFKRPTLIIHPEKDEYLPLHHPEDFLRASGAAIKEQVIVAGADHTFTSLAWEGEVISRTVDWFQQHL
jgi:uncharacterized protein